MVVVAEEVVVAAVVVVVVAAVATFVVIVVVLSTSRSSDCSNPIREIMSRIVPQAKRSSNTILNVEVHACFRSKSNSSAVWAFRSTIPIYAVVWEKYWSFFRPRFYKALNPKPLNP